jgi:hypothetical protein
MGKMFFKNIQIDLPLPMGVITHPIGGMNHTLLEEQLPPTIGVNQLPPTIGVTVTPGYWSYPCVLELPTPIGGKTVYHTGPLIGPDSKGFEF